MSEHVHMCKDAIQGLANAPCLSRGYCECDCGYVAPHPRISRPRDQEWMSRNEILVARATTPSAGIVQ
jgi:hypothetical protein